MFAYRSDPLITRFQNWEPRSVKEIRTFIAGLAEIGIDTLGRWYQLGLFIRESEELAGDRGIYIQARDPRQVEVGITLARAFRGRGLATEALKAVLDEVCFYRDLLWHGRRSARDEGLPLKRTFDLCLFGTRTIINIEAKAFEGSNSKQNRDFAKDAARIGELLGLKDIRVILVALASSKYYKAMGNYAEKETPAFFYGRISWAQVFEKYQEGLLLQADQLYESRIRCLSL